jgi:hypothetical protein
MRHEMKYRYGRIDGKIVREEVSSAHYIVNREVTLKDGTVKLIPKEVSAIVSTFNVLPEGTPLATEEEYIEQEKVFEEAKENFLVNLALKQKEESKL